MIEYVLVCMSAAVKVVGERFYWDKPAGLGSMTVRCPHGKPYSAQLEKRKRCLLLESM